MKAVLDPKRNLFQLIKCLPLLAVLLSSCGIGRPPNYNFSGDDDKNKYFAGGTTRIFCERALVPALWRAGLLEREAGVDFSTMVVHMHMGKDGDDGVNSNHCFMELGGNHYHLTIDIDTLEGYVVELSGTGASKFVSLESEPASAQDIPAKAPAVPVHGVYETEAGEKHTLYAVAREDEEATRWMADGRRVLHVLVTHEADSLNRGTASHYFAFNPEKLEKRKRLRLDALRFAPTTAGYMIIDDKEYMLTEILITLTDGGKWGVREAKLSRTGFIPPPFKGKLRPTFQPSMPMGPKAEAIVDQVIAETPFLEW